MIRSFLLTACSLLIISSANADPIENLTKTSFIDQPVQSAGKVRGKVATPRAAFAAAYSGDLVGNARRYLGTNPTGWSALWCGRFMAMVAPQAASRIKNPNRAREWAGAGQRVSGPQIGAIAVMGRGKRGGGHVGIVSGIAANGDPILISGNHNRRVAEAVYPKGRIYAYVMP